MFFSRRIGLNNSRQVPIAGGGRLTGRAGHYSVGVLDIQSRDDEPSKSRATNFTALRLFSTNARFRWEYRPGSEMFVVYSDGRDTALEGFPKLVNRAFIVKINRLFRL